MKLNFLLLASILFVLLTSNAKSDNTPEIVWEKEIQYLGVFIDSVKNGVFPDTKLYRCGDKFFGFYFGYLRDTEQDPDQDSVKTYFRYPAIYSFDKNGVILFQKEEYQSIIEENAKKYNGIDRYSRACKCSGDTLKVDIPQAVMQNKSPNIYNFNQANGNLIRIDGVSSLTQWSQLSKAVFTDKELLALGAWSPLIGLENDLKQNRIDVYDHFGKLNYRIILKNKNFLDSISAASGEFLYHDNNSFITKYPAKEDNTTYIAKFKYDTLEVENVVSGVSFPGELEWLTKLQPTIEKKTNSRGLEVMDNGDIITSGNLVIKLNKDGEVISNKILINNQDSNISYIINKVKKLTKPGYTAHFGYIIENKRRKFGIIIADENLNVVEEIKWQYDDKDTNKVFNFVEDIIETEEGNLIVLGRNQYFPSIIEVVDKLYIAAIRPNYITSVKDESDNNNGIVIYPNPTSDFITIQLCNIGLQPFAAEEKVQIFDVLGIEIMSELIHPMTSSNRMNVEKLPAGVYFIRIGDKVEKLVKM